MLTTPSARLRDSLRSVRCRRRRQHLADDVAAPFGPCDAANGGEVKPPHLPDPEILEAVVRARTARSGYVDLKLGIRVIKPVRPHAVLFVNCECGTSTSRIDPNVPPHRTNKAGELEFDNTQQRGCPYGRRRNAPG